MPLSVSVISLSKQSAGMCSKKMLWRNPMTPQCWAFFIFIRISPHAKPFYRIRLPDLNYPGAGNDSQQTSGGLPDCACIRGVGT